MLPRARTRHDFSKTALDFLIPQKNEGEVLNLHAMHVTLCVRFAENSAAAATDPAEDSFAFLFVCDLGVSAPMDRVDC